MIYVSSDVPDQVCTADYPRKACTKHPIFRTLLPIRTLLLGISRNPLPSLFFSLLLPRFIPYPRLDR